MKRLCFPNFLLILLVTGLMLAGCDLDLSGTYVLTGTVTIDITSPKIGDNLTAAYSGGNGTGTPSWQWIRDNELISGATGNTYTVSAGDVGHTLKARVSYSGRSGSVTSEPTAAVTTGFVAVTDITGVPTAGSPGTGLILTGTVSPANATNKTIVWSVKSPGTTGAAIAAGTSTLTATAAGVVVVTATITNGTAQGTNYTKDFTVLITGFVAVTGITGVPTTGTAGTPLTLSGTVAPATATNRTIAWSVQSAGTTGAVINGNTLNTTAQGTVTVRATIVNGTAQGTNYTREFSITINASFVAVTNITNVPSTGIAGVPLTLSGTVTPANATNKTIAWVVTESITGLITDGNTITAPMGGPVKVKATVANGTAAGTDYTQEFSINFTAFEGVTSITGVKTTGTVGIPLILSGTVNATKPPASYSTIAWSVLNAGTTRATITGYTLNAAAPGTVVVRASIVNGRPLGLPYTQDFTITIRAFVAVTEIRIPNSSSNTGDPGLTFNATVLPSNASCTDIIWTIKNSTSGQVTLTLNTSNPPAVTLKAVAPVIVELMATIENGAAPGINYTQDFPIVFNTPSP